MEEKLGDNDTNGTNNERYDRIPLTSIYILVAYNDLIKQHIQSRHAYLVRYLAQHNAMS
jgi:hypothetical protein